MAITVKVKININNPTNETFLLIKSFNCVIARRLLSACNICSLLISLESLTKTLIKFKFENSYLILKLNL